MSCIDIALFLIQFNSVSSSSTRFTLATTTSSFSLFTARRARSLKKVFGMHAIGAGVCRPDGLPGAELKH